MTSQLLPDDILALILEEHLTAGTGYNGGERLQTIKSVSLSSRTLALACRKLIFERAKVAVGGCPPRAPDAGLESPVEGLKELFEINPSYFGFVNSLRIEATLVCRLVEGIARSDVGPDSDINNQHGADRSSIVSIHYTSTTSEEAAICWLLSQRFPNLKSFHFIVHLADTSEQTTLRKAAFAKTLPSLALAADADLPEAVVRFLGAGNESLEHLTLSSNLPPPILRHFNGSKLKSLTLTKFSEAKPVNKSQTEIPFFLGLDDNAKLLPCPDVRSVEVENLSCDMSGGNLLHWLYGPQTIVDIRALKTLHLNPANEGRPFSFGPCSALLTDLDIVYSNRMTPPVSLGSLVALRRVIIRVEAQWSLDQVSFSLNTLPSQTIEYLEVGLRLTHVMDFKIIQLLTTLDRRLFTRKHEWENLKALRVVGYMSEGEWEKVEQRKGFRGFKDCLRSVFNPLLKGHGSAKSVLDVDVVKEGQYLRGGR